jgi:hypothetical protein
MAQLPAFSYLREGVPYWAVAGSGGGGGTSTFTQASISSLSVSSINGLEADQLDAAAWSFFPAQNSVDMNSQPLSNFPYIDGAGTWGIYADNAPVGSVNSSTFTVIVDSFFASANAAIMTAGTILGGNSAFSSINANLITANTFTSVSTVEVLSIVSTATVDTDVLHVSSINGASPDWWKNEAQSNVSMGGFYIDGISALYGTGANVFTVSAGNEHSLNLDGSNVVVNIGNSTIGNFAVQNNLSTIILANINGTTIPNLTASTINVPELFVSSVNGNEITASTIVIGSTISADGGEFQTLTATAFSTLGAEIKQGLMSSIVFNPQISPQFNIDLGMGDFLGTLGTGLFGVAVAVPVTAGTITYGLVKGLASLFEPRPINNIVSNQFETFNYASQLQVSTLNEQISTITRLVSTIPSTIVINDQPTNSTINTCDVEIYVSTLSPLPPFTAIRAIGDPVATVSTPWNVSQATPDYSWVPLPAEGGNQSTFSTITVNGDINLLPSTIIRSDSTSGVTYFIEPDGINMAQVAAQGFNVQNTIPGATEGIFTAGNSNPFFINPNASTFQLAYLNKAPTEFYVQTLGDDTTADGSISNPFQTIQAAITAAEAVSSGANQCVVIVAPGQYTENITFSKGYVAVIGAMNTQDGNQITSLNGDITVNVGNTDDLVARQVILQGLQIDGKLNDISAFQHTLIIQDCKFFDTETLLFVNPSAANQRTFITNSEFVQTGVSILPVVQFNVGQVQLERVDIDNSTNNTVLLYVSGTATLARCNFGNFESGTTATGTGVAPIVSVDSTSALVHTLGFTNIYYTSVSDKTGTANATGILFTTATTMTAIVLNCVFTLTGTSDLANQFIMKPFGAGVVTLLQADNQSSPAALGSCTLISPSFARADYVIPSMTAGITSTSQAVVSSLQGVNVSTNQLVTSSISGVFGSFGTISTNTINSLTANTSNLNCSTLTVGLSNFISPILNVNVSATPYDIMGVDVTVIPADRYLYFKVPGASDAVMYMNASNNNVGIDIIPESNFKFQVDGAIGGSSVKASTINTNFISTFGAGVPLQMFANENIELTPAAGSVVAVNDGAGPVGNQSGTIRFGNSEVIVSGYNGNETYIANNIYPGYYNVGWTGNVGRAIRVEYAIQTDNSFPSGLGQAEFTLPIGFSTLGSFQASYVAFQDNNPGLNHPAWLYSTITDGNGLISSIQIGAEGNSDVFVSVVGFV